MILIVRSAKNDGEGIMLAFSTSNLASEGDFYYEKNDLCKKSNEKLDKDAKLFCCGKKSDVTRQSKSSRPKKRLPLPWWCRIIAWIVNILGVFGALAFILFYGISFGDEKVRTWLTMIAISFSTGILITSPIKIFLTALVFAMILKKDDDADDDSSEVEENPELAEDEVWLHSKNEQYAYRKKKTVQFKPPDPAYIEAARALRLKEMKMLSVLKEISGYSFFLSIVFVVAYGNRPPAAFLVQNNLKTQFIDSVCAWEPEGSKCNHISIAQGVSPFQEIARLDDIWDYLRFTFLPGIREHKWYNNEPPKHRAGFIADRVSKLIGYPTIRQIRVKKDACDFAADMASVLKARHCHAKYSTSNKEDGHFDSQWRPKNLSAISAANEVSETEWTYVTAKNLDSYPTVGSVPATVYGGGGYVWRLNKGNSHLEANLKMLKEQKWIDEFTRAIIIDFAVYNPQVNLFATASLTIEIMNTATILTSYRFNPLLLTYKLEGFYLLLLIATMMYFVSMIYFTFKILRGLKKEKLAFLKNFWNLIEVGINIVSWIAVINFAYRQLVVQRITEQFGDTSVSKRAYINMQWVNIINDGYSYCLAFVTFFCTIKYLRLLRFNRKMSLLGSLLKHCAPDLAAFSLMYSVAFAMFVQVFCLIFGTHLVDFRNLTNTSLRLMCMILGKFDFYEMLDTSTYLGPLIFFIYIVFMVIIIMNVFVTILNESLNEVKEEMTLQSNEYEIVDFILKKVKSYLGVYEGNDLEVSVPRNAPSKEIPNLDACEKKIQRFVNSILNVYNPDVDDEMQELIIQLHGLKKKSAKNTIPNLNPSSSFPKISKGVNCDLGLLQLENEKITKVLKSQGVLAKDF